MKIKVSYYGQARAAAGIELENVDVGENMSLSEIISGRVSEHEELKKLLIDPEGALRRSVMFSINDEAVDPGGAVKVSEGDIVSVFPAIAGG